MTAIAAELGAELRAVPGVQNVGGHVGRAVLSDRVNGISAGELGSSIDPEPTTPRRSPQVADVADGYRRRRPPGAFLLPTGSRRSAR